MVMDVKAYVPFQGVHPVEIIRGNAKGGGRADVDEMAFGLMGSMAWP